MAHFVDKQAKAALWCFVIPQRGWEVQDGKLLFAEAPKAAGAKELPSLELINYTLTYAKELERIV
jgi:hypothetical protein